MNDEATEIYRSEYKPLGFVFTITRSDDGLLDASVMQQNREWRTTTRGDLLDLAAHTTGLAEWLRDSAETLDAVARDMEEGAA